MRRTCPAIALVALALPRDYTETWRPAAAASLKKLVIPDGCADSRPQRLFVCK